MSTDQKTEPEVKLPPLHEFAIPYLQGIAQKYSVKTRNDLAIGQAEFRGALGMMMCHIPKGHIDLRDAVRNFALQLDMVGDEVVEKVADHLLQERDRADKKQKSGTFAAAEAAQAAGAAEPKIGSAG